MTSTDTQTVTLSSAQWEGWLATLCDLPDSAGPAAMPAQERPPRTEAMDAYALSAYAEALQSSEIDGGLWETYEDLELEGARDDEAAWSQIKDFYVERGAVLLVIKDGGRDEMSEVEEWLFASELLERLKLTDYLRDHSHQS